MWGGGTHLGNGYLLQIGHMNDAEASKERLSQTEGLSERQLSEESELSGLLLSG